MKSESVVLHIVMLVFVLDKKGCALKAHPLLLLFDKTGCARMVYPPFEFCWCTYKGTSNKEHAPNFQATPGKSEKGLIQTPTLKTQHKQTLNPTRSHMNPKACGFGPRLQSPGPA